MVSDDEEFYIRIAFDAVVDKKNYHEGQAEEHRLKAEEHREAEAIHLDRTEILEYTISHLYEEYPWLADLPSYGSQISSDQNTLSLMDHIQLAITQPEAVIKVASLIGPEVTTQRVAEMLHRSGRWKATPETLRTTVTKVLRKHPHWLALGNGRYRQTFTAQSD